MYGCFLELIRCIIVMLITVAIIVGLGLLAMFLFAIGAPILLISFIIIISILAIFYLIIASILNIL